MALAPILPAQASAELPSFDRYGKSWVTPDPYDKGGYDAYSAFKVAGTNNKTGFKLHAKGNYAKIYKKGKGFTLGSDIYGCLRMVGDSQYVCTSPGRTTIDTTGAEGREAEVRTCASVLGKSMCTKWYRGRF
ncbi:hypothetical protein [Spirillospora sp. NBC_01491]|nr:hypothetical protein [Spirillospora sp. NBC_01491]